MGSVMSSSCSKKTETNQEELISSESCNRPETSSPKDEDYLRSFPSLPDELSLQILARLPRICYSRFRLVSRGWNSTLSNSKLYSLRKELGKTEEWLYVLSKIKEDDQLSLHGLDPVSKKWQRLPPMPVIDYQEESRTSSFSLWNMVSLSFSFSEIVKRFLGKEEIVKKIPFCGCTLGSLDGYLYVLGGLSGDKTVSTVWRFDPIFSSWSEVSPMLATRAYPRTCALGNKLYVVGGCEWRGGHLSPLQSAEIYDPSTDTWTEVPKMPCIKAKAQAAEDAFEDDMFKPTATNVTCFNGKLYVPQSLYSWPFYVDAGGEVYDPEANEWYDMPSGMGEGWPALEASTKQSVVLDGELYSFEPPSTRSGSGKILVYDQDEDTWRVVIDEVPRYDLNDPSRCPYLLVGFHGKLHFITKDSNLRVNVFQADVQNILGSSSSSSNTVLDSSSLSEETNAPKKLDALIWKVLASKDIGGVELIGCQVINI